MICEKDPDDEEVLGRLMDFLKKELRVQQHKWITQGKFEDKAPLKLKAVDKNKHYQTRSTGQSNQAPKCYFCHKDSKHILNNGENGSIIIQYLACEKFCKMTQRDQFITLKRKGYCTYQLYP